MDAQDNPGATDTLPLFAVTRRMGEQLWSFFDNADSIAATIERYAQGWPAFEDIASFSSFGPTTDLRIKPDIVAPGELVSAASADMDVALAKTDTCNIGRKAGTSMATPMAAGHTAIMRQYFMDGYYPTGTTGNPPFLPSGPLLKAVMLGGACDMQGNTEQYLPLEDSPSMRQGFGRFCMCNALKLLNNCTTNLQVRALGGSYECVDVVSGQSMGADASSCILLGLTAQVVLHHLYVPRATAANVKLLSHASTSCLSVCRPLSLSHSLTPPHTLCSWWTGCQSPQKSPTSTACAPLAVMCA